MKQIKKILIILLISVFSITTFSAVSNAASGYEGYAIYRDGTSGLWHAGIFSSTEIIFKEFIGLTLNQVHIIEIYLLQWQEI